MNSVRGFGSIWKYRITLEFRTLGGRDFSCAVSGLGQSFLRGFADRYSDLRPKLKICRPAADATKHPAAHEEKTSGTQSMSSEAFLKIMNERALRFNAPFQCFRASIEMEQWPALPFTETNNMFKTMKRYIKKNHERILKWVCQNRDGSVW